jgi:uncharacterized iron-regulated protein
MSVTEQQAQDDLDQLTALSNDLVPKVIKTMNNQAAIIAALQAGQKPAIDPAKVEADVQAINKQLADLAIAQQNDAPPPAPSAPAP